MTNIALVIIGWTLVTNHVNQFRSKDTNGTEYVNNVYAIQEAPVIGYERDGKIVPLAQLETKAAFTNSFVSMMPVDKRAARPTVDPTVGAASTILNTNRRPARPVSPVTK